MLHSRPHSPPSTNPADRAVTIVVCACAASGGIHAALIPEHLREAAPLGGLFVLAVVALLTAGATLLVHPEDRRAAQAVGNAIKPYYGRKAANKLTRLLEEHITGAVDLVVAAKAGDEAALATAKTAWYANGRDVADFLSAANPDNWPRSAVRSMMKRHLDQTVDEAVAQLTGRYATGIREYDAIERHMLEMADTLSSGIIKQFPARFR